MSAVEDTTISRREPLRDSQALSKGDALAQLRAGRTGTPAPVSNPVSEAARTLGQRSAAARAERPQHPQVQPRAEQPVKSPVPVVEQPAEETESRPDEGTQGHEAEEEQPDLAEDTGDEASEDAVTLNDGQSVIIDGERLTATEIKESYFRLADYTKKTQEMAQERQGLATAIGAVTQQSERLNQLEGLLTQAVSQEPDWAAIARSWQGSQMEFTAYQENWKAQKQALNNVIAERQRAVNTTIAQAKAQMFDEASRTFRPDWQDKAKMQSGVQQLADFAVSQGIRPEELQMLYRTPMLKILAMAHEKHVLDTTQRITDKKVQGKPKPLKPGTQRSRPNGAETALATARQSWESTKNPTTADARAWIRAKSEYTAATGTRVKG